MTPEEKAKLEKLSKDDLIEMLDKTRDKANENEEAAVKERAKIMREFFDGGKKSPADTDEGTEKEDFRETEVFKRLKRKFA